MFKKNLIVSGGHNKVIMGVSYNKKKFHKIKRVIKFLLLFFIGLFFVTFIGFSIRFRINVIKGLPDVKNIKDMIFSQASVITDRNGKELYKIFEENREYISYEKISQNMINAIVSIEDKRFWTQSGLDPWGMLRAAITRHGGASTITQQLIKNLLLNPELKKETTKEKVVRKLREIVLVSKLRNSLKDQIKLEKSQKFDSDEMKLEINKKVLELYLNYVSFGNNAFGVQTAAKTYFNKNADSLDVFESAILASIPKGQGLYDPLKRPKKVNGEVKITDDNGDSVEFSGDLKNIIKSKLENILSQTDLSNQKDNEKFVEFIKGLFSFSVFHNGKNYYVKYTPGRKDSVLSRMYEDGKINSNELKFAFLKGIGYKFSQPVYPIKAPHFVWRVREELEKIYGKDKVLKGGWTIKTTLDYDLQQMAENVLSKNRNAYLNTYGANNSAMIYVDSKNGDVLSYVGSIDFFNEEIDGQVDVIRSKRQVGSSIKPLIYAIGFEKLGIALDTPIFDIPFKVGPDSPNNADGRFYGLLPLKKALAYSRNIPAIKMFLALGGEDVAKPLLKKIGLSSLIDDHHYGYPLALGAGEIPLIELANAYMHLSALGKPAKLNPVLEITTPSGDIIYKKEVEYQEQIIKPGIASVIWRILSDKVNMPPEWAGKYSVSGLTFGIKSGTSNMKTPKGDRARDGLLVTYTPSKVIIFWGGNTDGSPMFKNAYGGFFNAPATTEYWSTILKNNYIENEAMKTVDIVNVRINKLNGKTITDKTPSEFIVDSSTYLGSIPAKDDSSIVPIQIDKLCNGKISPYTPSSDIVKGYFYSPVSSFMPSNMDLKDIKERRKNSSKPISGDSIVDPEDNQTKAKVVYFKDANIFVDEPLELCEGRTPKEDPSISINILKPSNNGSITSNFNLWFNAQGPRNINKVIVNFNELQIGFFEYKGDKQMITDTKVIKLEDIKELNNKIKVEVIDVGGYSNWTTIDVNVVQKDETPPFLLQDKINVKQTSEGKYNIVMIFEDELSAVIGGKIIFSGSQDIDFKDNIVTFTLDSLGVVSIAVLDSENNVLKQDVDLSIYQN